MAFRVRKLFGSFEKRTPESKVSDIKNTKKYLFKWGRPFSTKTFFLQFIILSLFDYRNQTAQTAAKFAAVWASGTYLAESIDFTLVYLGSLKERERKAPGGPYEKDGGARQNI